MTGGERSCDRDGSDIRAGRAPSESPSGVHTADTPATRPRPLDAVVPRSNPRTTLRALPQGASPGGGTAARISHIAWNDIRVDHVARAGGEAAVEAGKREMLAEVYGSSWST